MKPIRSRASSGSPYESTVGFSRAVRHGNHVFVAGTAPVWPDGQVDPDPTAQTRRVWAIVLEAMDELGASRADVVRTRHFITTPAIVDEVSVVHGEVFGDVRPASTMVVVAGLLDPRWLVEVEVDAIVDTST